MSDKDSIDKLLESNYDGIRECDNDLPQWWLILFYVTIVFGISYVAYRSLFTGVTATEILQARLESIEVMKTQGQASGQAEIEPTEEELLALYASEEAVKAGREIFVARCTPCHGQNGEGGIGPNLTDKYWLHGGKLRQIRHTVVRGVLEKGMLAWKGVLKEDEIEKVTVYIKSISGSNPANAKAPQGTLEE